MPEFHNLIERAKCDLHDLECQNLCPADHYLFATTIADAIIKISKAGEIIEEMAATSEKQSVRTVKAPAA